MSVPKHAYYFYEFGPFQVDVTNHLLLRDGSPVPLAPKVWDALFILVENSGHILVKEELMNRLWPDCFVEEGNLTQIIFQLRKALGESAAKQQYIETIPKRGYRFIARIKVVNGEFEQRIGTKLTIKGDAGDSGDSGDEADDDAADERALINGKEAMMAARKELASPAPFYRPVEIGSAKNQLPAIRHSFKWLTITAAVISALLVIAFGLAYFFRWNRSAASFKKVPQISKLTSSGKAQRPALSSNGKYVAYVLDDAGRQSIWVRQVNSTSNAQVVPPSEVNFQGMTFSPDGSFILYVVLERDQQNGTLYQAPVLGGTPRKILSGVDSTITFSPDGKKFAFVRRNTEMKETFLITANADGSGEQRLAARKMPEIFSVRGPAWSPDGKILALAGGRNIPGNSYMDVITVNVADGAIARLGSQTWTLVGSTAWLKDGSGVVVSAWHQQWPVFANQLWHLSYPNGEVSRVTNDLSTHEGASIATHADELVTGQSVRISRLWVAPNGDANRARLIRSGYGDNYSEVFGLCWTPNGRLVYGSHAGNNADIWIMDSDGGNQKQLTYNTRREVAPVVSGDGRYIVYVSQGSGSSHLWRMDADGRNPRQLTQGMFDSGPSISPDGRWIVYSSYDESAKQTLWKVSIDGSDPIQLTRHTSNSPSVSPDGKSIACQHMDEKTGRMVVAIVPFIGGNPTEVFDEMPLPTHGLLRWTPDGRALTYIVTNDGVSNIWLQPLDGGQPKQMTNFKEDQIFRLAWSHDGKDLAYDRGVTIKDIILISDFR